MTREKRRACPGHGPVTWRVIIPTRFSFFLLSSGPCLRCCPCSFMFLKGVAWKGKSCQFLQSGLSRDRRNRGDCTKWWQGFHSVKKLLCSFANDLNSRTDIVTMKRSRTVKGSSVIATEGSQPDFPERPLVSLRRRGKLLSRTFAETYRWQKIGKIRCVSISGFRICCSRKILQLSDMQCKKMNSMPMSPRHESAI